MLDYFANRTNLTGRLMILVGAIWTATGVLQAIRPDWITTDVLEHWGEHVMMAGFSLALLMMIPAYALLSRYATGSTPVKFVAVGNVALAATITVSNINGDDPSWFVIAAPISNLLWFGGSIALAVLMRRAGRVPAWVYVGLPLAWIAALPLSPIGGPVLAGAYWIAVGSLVLLDSLEQRGPVPASA